MRFVLLAARLIPFTWLTTNRPRLLTAYVYHPGENFSIARTVCR